MPRRKPTKPTPEPETDAVESVSIEETPAEPEPIGFTLEEVRSAMDAVKVGLLPVEANRAEAVFSALLERLSNGN